LTPEFVDLLTGGSAVGILGWLVLALINGWLVTKSVVQLKDEQIARAQRDADFWRDIALKGTDIAEQMVKAKLAEVEGKKP
jgi:hypothetical protein